MCTGLVVDVGELWVARSAANLNIKLINDETRAITEFLDTISILQLRQYLAEGFCRCSA